MVIILVLITFALFITISLLASTRTERKHETSTLKFQSLAVTDQPERFFHPGYSWAFVDQPRSATIGIDNFVQRFLGRVERIELPANGASIRQGEPLVKIHHGNKSLTLVSPLSGILTDVNQSLVEHPELLNESPYSDGWLIKIFPQNIKVELRNLMKGVTASIWREALRTRLVHWFTPRIGPVLQDGGTIIDNFSDMLPYEEWKVLVQEFFPLDIQEEQTNLKPLNKGLLP